MPGVGDFDDLTSAGVRNCAGIVGWTDGVVAAMEHQHGHAMGQSLRKECAVEGACWALPVPTAEHCEGDLEHPQPGHTPCGQDFAGGCLRQRVRCLANEADDAVGSGRRGE